MFPHPASVGGDALSLRPALLSSPYLNDWQDLRTAGDNSGVGLRVELGRR